ncbi:MAG: AMP-binding protein [Burkholderiales bacterium]
MQNAGLRDVARYAPERIALVHEGQRLTYGELERRANRLARKLRACGLRRGDHVAALLPNGGDLLCTVWAAYRCGLYFTPIATTLAPPEVAYIIGNSTARVVVSHAGCAGLATALPKVCDAAGVAVEHWLALGTASGPEWARFTALEAWLASADDSPISDEAPGALMLYTSGTTGAPKGVRRPLPPVDHTGLPLFARDVLELFDMHGEAVRYLSTQPLYHAAALRPALAVTAGGGTVVLMSRFDASQALELIEREAITHSQWVPTMFQRLLALPAERRDAFRAPAHRLAWHGAAPCLPSIKRAMIEWWGPILLEYYAGTEGVGVTTIDSVEWLAHPGSVGRARRGVIHILDEAGGELPPGQAGRVYFAGATAFSYHGESGKTAQRTSEQGWQTLGDIGRLDDQGYLYLLDRADDMIISGGVNVYPQEIEVALMEVPGVADCGVIGQPDANFGERPHAYVVPSDTARGDLPALRAAIDAHVRDRLGRIKWPAEIKLCAQLPRSETGKLLRKNLPFTELLR